MHSRLHRWENRARDGECAFITTRTLDWTNCFVTPTQKDALTRSLLSDCIHYRAELHAFVVMSNHLHLLVNIPSGKTGSWFVQRIKTNSSKILLPMQTEAQLAQLATQQGLSRRVLWQNTFKSVQIMSVDAFVTRMNYIELNPVRAGICNSGEEYRWSSLHLIAKGVYDKHGNLDVARALQFYS